MTRRHYQLIADVIRSLPFPVVARLFIAERFADRLEREFPRFDRSRFISAVTE